MGGSPEKLRFSVFENDSTVIQGQFKFTQKQLSNQRTSFVAWLTARSVLWSSGATRTPVLKVDSINMCVLWTQYCKKR